MNSPVSVFYCKATESPSPSNRLVPAPLITINPEIYYANDNVIGYTYRVSLRGYANSVKPSSITGLSGVIDSIGDIRDIFNINGGDLYIKNGDHTGPNIIVAKGATIQDFNFETSNNLTVYSPYTINIEFNEVDFIGCTNNPQIACASSFFHSPHQSGTSIINDNLIDIKKYKIKSFNDKWSFTIEDSIYQNYHYLNNTFRVSYTLSATGKNYYVGGTLVPAWEQAKQFAQDRLYKQVKGLIAGILQLNGDGCSPSKSIDQLHGVDAAIPKESGLFDDTFTLMEDGNGNKFDIYNETISCDTSESDGTFSLTYNAIIKIKSGKSEQAEKNAALHSYTKDINISEGNNQNVTISVKGTIEGLVPGGFIHYDKDYFELPQNGNFISIYDKNVSKYQNALAFYFEHIGDKNDLLPEYKTLLNINKGELSILGNDNESVDFRASSFVLDHGYLEGTIGYTATYDKLSASTFGKGYTNITIDRKDPIEMVQEFVVPGRASGPIIQRLGMKSAKVVTVNINGASDMDKFVGTTLQDINVCDTQPTLPDSLTSLLTSEGTSNSRVTKKEWNINKIDGSYNLTVEYTYFVP